MTLRDKLKIKPPVIWDWYTGDDVPLTWSKEEIARMRFQCCRHNYLNKNMSEEEYRKEVKRYRESKRI